MKTKTLLATILWLAIPALMLAGSPQKDFEKANKQTIANLKTRYGAKEISPVFNPFDNNRHVGYSIKVKNAQGIAMPDGTKPKALCGFLDANGEMVVPCLYQNLFPREFANERIILLAASNYAEKDMYQTRKGYFDITGKEIVPVLYNSVTYKEPATGKAVQNHERFQNGTGWYYQRPGTGTFECENGALSFDPNKSSKFYSIYGLDGKPKLLDVPQFGFQRIDGYILYTFGPAITCYENPNDFIGNSPIDEPKVGLATSAGEPILPPQYNAIRIYTSETPAGVKNYCHYYTATLDGGECHGVIDLKTGEEIIPFNMASIKYLRDKDQWSVKFTEFTDYETFDPQKVNNLFAELDPGIRLYMEGKYDDVIKYYANEGVDSKYAQVYGARAIFNIGSEGMSDMMSNVTMIEFQKRVGAKSSMLLMPFDFDGHYNYLATAYNLASTYLAETDAATLSSTEDKVLYKMAKDVAYNAELKRTFLKEYAQKYKDVEYYAQHSEDMYAARQAEQQAQMLTMFLTCLDNSINAFNSAQAQRSSNSATRSTSAASKKGASKGSSISSNNEPQGLNNAEKRRYEEVKKQIDHFYSEIAELESYQISDPSSSRARLISNCRRNISKLEDEKRELESRM